MVDKHRVQKLIANSNYCSRRRAEDLINSGLVKVNGKIIKIGACATINDKIEVNGTLINLKQKKIYIMLNKPKRYITTSSDPYDRKKVLDLIDIPDRVFPVGRLDRDARGLLLLTNDGDFSNRIQHPRYEISKTYRVRLDKNLTFAHKVQLEKGIKLKDVYVTCKIYIIKPNLVDIKLHVGKNKIVKRIFNYFDYNVDDLKRIKIGSLELGKLPEGHFRHLKSSEIKNLINLSKNPNKL